MKKSSLKIWNLKNKMMYSVSFRKCVSKEMSQNRIKDATTDARNETDDEILLVEEEELSAE